MPPFSQRYKSSRRRFFFLFFLVVYIRERDALGKFCSTARVQTGRRRELGTNTTSSVAHKAYSQERDIGEAP